MSNNKKFIIGKNCLEELIEYAPERIVSAFTTHRLDDKLIKKLLLLKVPVKEKGRKKLDDLVNSTSHQGYVAEVIEKAPVFIEDIIKASESKKNSLVVILDSIFDPQNVGAILRSAECFGVDCVIISKNKGCKITPTVTKTSVGATEIVPIAEVSNLTTTIEKFQKAGYWAISAEISAKAVSLNTFEYPEKTILVLGSEGKGVQKIISKKADFHVFIPMLGRIDSLNVSQAAAVFMQNYSCQQLENLNF